MPSLWDMVTKSSGQRRKERMAAGAKAEKKKRMVAQKPKRSTRTRGIRGMIDATSARKRRLDNI